MTNARKGIYYSSSFFPLIHRITAYHSSHFRFSVSMCFRLSTLANNGAPITIYHFLNESKRKHLSFFRATYILLFCM